MAEYNTSFAVGGAQTFGQAWAPCNGDIGTVTSNWLYGGGCAYPAPYRSFQQNLINGNNYLGPYCRRLDGVAGRLKVSISAQIGEIGFVQQCWYDYPRGVNDKVDGVVADTNQVWWDTKVSRKHWVQVYNLNDDNAPLIWVQVAISAGTTAYPLLSMHDVSNGPLQGDCIRYIRSAHNLYGGQTNPLQLYTGIPGNCGIKSDTLSTLAIPYVGISTNTGQGGWLPDVSFLENGAFAGMGWCLASDGEAATEAGVIWNSLNSTQQAAAGSTLSDANRSNNFLAALNDHLAKVKDFLGKLSTFHYGAAAGNFLARKIIQEKTLELISAAPMAGRLMLDAWWLPNLRKYGANPNNGPTGTASNPYKWRPPDHIQQRWAGHLLDNGSTGAPFGGGTDFRAYIPGTTPNKRDENGNVTGEPDWAWYLTLLNRGDTTTVPVVDSATNEFVFHENYGFGRGGSVQSADPFLNWVDSVYGTQTGNSVGAILDMSPATPFFYVLRIMPILEAGGAMIKVKKGQTPGATNIDGYDTMKFEIRISAKNMKAGNSRMYNYLVNTGDANGNKFTAVP